VIASDLPVLREIFDGAARFATDADTFAARLDDALTWQDPQLRTAGRCLAAGYTWSAAAAEHLRFYRALTASTPSWAVARGRPGASVRSGPAAAPVGCWHTGTS
jgi:hypothetical protein